MRLKEEFRNCAVLIGAGSVDSEDEIEPWGTGFLVERSGPPSAYLVTAAHVVSKYLDAPFDIRFNVKGEGARVFKIEYPDWVFHPTDNTVDVAVHEIEVPDSADVTFVARVPNLALGDRLDKKNIGAGNRTYTVGLWKFLHSKRRNQMFVYTGHIGLIPDGETIPVDAWLPEHHGKRIGVEGYLIEGEPLDGASGSPVFVRRTLDFDFEKRKGKPPLEAHVEGSVWLLGLQSDAFVGRPGEDYEIPTAGPRLLVPRGVNVVVPVEKIIEVLEHPKLKVARDDAVDQVGATEVRSRTATASSGKQTPRP